MEVRIKTREELLKMKAGGIDIVATEQLAEIVVRRASLVPIALIHNPSRGFPPLRIHIAHGYHPGLLVAEEIAHDPIALRPIADATHRDAIARRDMSIRA